MKAEVQKIFKLYEELEEAGETATLTFSTRGGMSTVKLQLQASSSTAPSSSTSTPTLLPAPGKRRRHRGARARARRNKRAAAHQASLAEAATTTSPSRPGFRKLPRSRLMFQRAAAALTNCKSFLLILFPFPLLN